MFTSKSFNLSSILSKPKSQNRSICVLEPSDNQQNQKQNQQFNKLRQQNLDLKQQLQKLKELFIQTKIQHDNEVRAYDEIVEQLRTQLGEKQSVLEKYYESLKQEENQKRRLEICSETQEQHFHQDETHNQNPVIEPKNIKIPSYEQVSELMMESTISFKQKYEASLCEIESLKIQCEKLKHELQYVQEKQTTLGMTNDVSFTGKGESKISFDFGDITQELKDVDEVAHFSHGSSHISVDQEEISVREQRIQNLERQNFQLQHELASKSHKLARIFNAAFEFGGMQLLDYLQSSIGLVQTSENNQQP